MTETVPVIRVTWEEFDEGVRLAGKLTGHGSNLPRHVIWSAFRGLLTEDEHGRLTDAEGLRVVPQRDPPAERLGWEARGA